MKCACLLVPILLAIAAASASESAQAIPAGGHIKVPGSPVPGVYGTIVHGDLDGDWSPEIAVIRLDAGDALLVFHNPDATSDAVQLATGVLDVCYLPVPVASGSAGLLFSTPSGMWVARFDAALGVYDVDPLQTSPEMMGALRVRYASELGLHRIFFQGKALGDEIRSFYSTNFDGTSFTQQALLGMVPSVPLDFVLLDYVTGGRHELAILHTIGLTIRSQTAWSTPLASRSSIVSGDVITPVQVQGVGTCLAWVTRTSSNPNEQATRMLLFHPTFLAGGGYPNLSLGNVTYQSATSADVDADGRADIVLGCTFARVDAFRQQGAYPYFLNTPDLTPSMTSGNEVPETVEMGRIVCGNLFNDRDESGNVLPGYAAILPEENVLRMRVSDQARLNALEGGTGPISDYRWVRYEVGLTNTCVLAPNTTVARWSLTLGSGWGATTANAVQVVVRLRRQNSTNLVPTVFHNQRVWLNPLPENIEGMVIPFDTSSLWVQDCAPEGPSADFFAMIRPILVPGSGTAGTFVPPSVNPLLVWRWSVLGVSGDCTELAEMRASPFGLTPEIPICVRPAGFDCPGNVVHLSCPALQMPVFGEDTILPTAVPMSRVPSTTPNALPIYYQFNY